jgi:hypothetical protein
VPEVEGSPVDMFLLQIQTNVPRTGLSWLALLGYSITLDTPRGAAALEQEEITMQMK